jgi:hypothetical protein
LDLSNASLQCFFLVEARENKRQIGNQRCFGRSRWGGHGIIHNWLVSSAQQEGNASCLWDTGVKKAEDVCPEPCNEGEGWLASSAVGHLLGPA